MDQKCRGKVAAIDLGTAKVCATVGELGEAGQIVLRGVGTGLARGWREFQISQPAEVTAAVSHAVLRAARMAATNISQVIISLSGPYYDFFNTSALVQVSPSSGKITLADLKAAQDLARDKAADPEQVILHLLPKKYLVERETLFQPPLGQTARTLEVEYLVIRAPRSLLEQLSRLVGQAGPQVLAAVFPPLADIEVMLAGLPPDPGYLLLNLGGAVTEALIVKQGLPQAATVIPLGGQHITYDLAWALKISQPEAERLKILYGYAWPEGLGDEDEIEILIQGRAGTRSRRVYRRFLSEIINSRALEILAEAKNFVQQQGGDACLPVVLTGGGSLLKGLDKLAQSFFGANIRREIPEGESDIVDSPVYTTGVGLMLYGLKNRIYNYPAAAKPAGWLGLYDRFRSWLKDIL